MQHATIVILSILGSLAMSSLFLVGAVAAEPNTGGVDLSAGDPAEGEAIYTQNCVACHGDQAQGNEALNAPRLAEQEPWYMARQLKNFQLGVRGTDPKDVYGMQMRPMAITLEGDQAIADVVAYIVTLNPAGE